MLEMEQSTQRATNTSLPAQFTSSNRVQKNKDLHKFGIRPELMSCTDYSNHQFIS